MHNPSLQKHILSWSQLLDIGEDLPESRLDDRLKRLAINHCCTLVYDTPEKESSAPGPRGGMLSHDNLLFSTYREEGAKLGRGRFCEECSIRARQ